MLGTVCGVDIDTLYNKSMQQIDQTITGTYTFLVDLKMGDDLEVTGEIDGYKLEDKVDHMVLTTDDVIHGR